MGRVRSALAALMLATTLCLTGLPGIANAGTARDAQECAANLDCTAEEINRMSMPERLEFIRLLSSGPAAELLPGYAPRWRNIEGIIDFFDDNDMGAPGTWVSYVDAGILEGIERGLALALGHDTDTFGNPGSRLWAEYLIDLHNGELTGRSRHDRAWSRAEQASTEHGVYLAEVVHTTLPTDVEQRFFDYSEFYRWIMRNRPLLLDLGSAPVRSDEQQVTFLDWFTDVTNPTPSRKGADLAYEMAGLNIPGTVLSMLWLFEAYAHELAGDYLADIRSP